MTEIAQPTGTVNLAIFPREDVAFARLVERTLAQLPAADRRGPESLQAALRRWHAPVVVRARHSLASVDGDLLYVYRDGRPGAPVEAGWWHRPGVAAVRFRADGRFVWASEAACELLEVPPGSLAGRRWSDLAPPEAGGDAAWAWDQLGPLDFLQSVFDVALPGGRRRIIEFRSEPTEEPGVFASWWREVALLEGSPPVQR